MFQHIPEWGKSLLGLKKHLYNINKIIMTGLNKTPKTEVEVELEEPGKLTLVCGPMYAGKTSHLIANYEKHKDQTLAIYI